MATMDPYQFYPTGAKTAARMWAKFKRPISTSAISVQVRDT